MENYWIKSHITLLEMKVGDYYLSGGNKMIITKKTKRRIYFSDGSLVTIKKLNDFFYLNGKNINQILRDIEGYLIYKIHSNF